MAHQPEAQSHAQRKAGMADGFDATLLGNEDSPAYQSYNRRIYGWDRFGFNIIDAPQRDALLRATALRAGQRFVDIGCATGALTAWLADDTDADGLGLDFAPKAIARAQQRYPPVAFEVQDLDALFLRPQAFDVAVALDTLYFPADLPTTLGRVFAALRPGGRLVAMYSANGPSESVGRPVFETSGLGRALAQLGRAAALEDHTDGAARVWRTARATLDELEEAFVAEGRRDLWEQRDAEVTRELAMVEQGRKSRWLVTVEV